MSKQTQHPASRFPVCVLTKHPKRKAGDKGQWQWEVVANGRKISHQSELLCNRKQAVRDMRITVAALTIWLLNEDGTPAGDDGEFPTDALSTPTQCAD